MTGQRPLEGRKRLLAAQDGRCYYCATEIRLPFPGEQVLSSDPTVATVEHLQPRALGGVSGWVNCVMACGWCNNGWASLIDQWAIKVFGETHEAALQYRSSHGLL